MAAGDSIISVNLTGSQTDVGSSANVPSAAVIKNTAQEDVTGNYNITYVNGLLTVSVATGADLNITDYSDVYDADAHSISVTNLIDGDVAYYSLTNNGEDWSTTKPMFTNVTAETTVYVKVVNPNYNDRIGTGKVTITARPITITAASDSKVYDGTPLINSNWSHSSGSLATGDSIDNVAVKGKQTQVGSSNNVASAAVIKNAAEEDVTGNYDITYVGGTLTVTKRSDPGGGGGDPEPIVVPEPEPTVPLNKEDHFAYVQGYPDNTVRPQGNVTREEVAAVFYRLLDANYREGMKTSANNFPDVGLYRWSSKHIGTLTAAYVIEGYPDGTFRPGNYITRAELAAIASRFDELTPFEANSFSDIAGHWANKYINSAAQKGWVNGYPDGTFRPDQAITRAEFMTLVNNVLDRRVLQEDIHPEARQFPDLTEAAWYYEAVQEAINSHLYTRETPTDFETWTEVYYPVLDM
ncbi:filamentous hemeagglutinin family outer membrane protein [hydrocarbon metagenome]|uniref:Filamentous hemeagglutinin family outer membrane protein n=1 Tax=hydrocarbon metagenome TaxID=938273 RepID=A0A0W8E123_9ZZZZ